ncbi:MAG: phosphate acyltransferase PlsX [Oscillospiraceae bacterium]|nr:phosphate acyltransferase PlsX [Oscillospiraceae bacterium]
MRIIVDAMSGDNGPREIIAGAVTGAKESGAELVLTGDENIINGIIAKEKMDCSNVKICAAGSVISMDDDAFSVVKSKSDSSMSVGLNLLKDGVGDAFVSAGNTGALLLGSSLILKRSKGVKRAAIGTVLPFTKPLLLLDSGANTEASAKNLLQYAVMGTVYYKSMFGLDSPRVGLLNNGAERTKGTPAYLEAYSLLEKESGINFVGNIEGRDIPFGTCDVLVCDGFTGNIVLKLCEGFGSFLTLELKKAIMSSLTSKIGGFLIRKEVSAMKRRLDSTEYGGAPMLGISMPVIKAHGASGEKAIKNAFRQACSFAAGGIPMKIETAVAPIAD